jgi:hypothetical protein
MRLKCEIKMSWIVLEFGQDVDDIVIFEVRKALEVIEL